MKLSNLHESKLEYSRVQKFVIMSWGKLLYLDYDQLPTGKNWSNSQALEDIAEEYLNASEEERDDMDEWIAEGCKHKNGPAILTQETVDSVLKSCEAALDQPLTLYRFGDVRFKWVSATIHEDGYGGERKEIHLKRNDRVIDTRGLADDGEYIIRDDLL